MTYIECPECGQKALSVATQCPRCGHAYPAHFLPGSAPPPGPRKLRPVLALGGVAGVLAVVVLVVVLNRPGSDAVSPPPVAAPPPFNPAPSAPSQPASEPPAGNGAPPVAPPPSGLPPALGEQLRRYARTWVNVRGGRSAGAPAVRVLNPGDAVLVDSLERGWYRVLVDGRTLGYAHRANLGSVPPPVSP